MARVSARQLWIAIESVHAVTYFAPACRHARRDAGLKGFWAGYFAARAAPLGRVDAGPVIAAFFNFEPAMVRRAVPACWDVVEPAELTVGRASAAAEALLDLCRADSVAGLVGALPLLRRAGAGCDGAGRIMTGANRTLWPAVETGLRRMGLTADQTAVAEAWQWCTTLREHRGDGHVAALVAHDLRGLEAHLLAAGSQGLPVEVLRDSRGWSASQWEEGVARLADRGLLRPDGAATDDGQAVRRSVESVTDELAARALATLDDEEVDRVYRALFSAAADVQRSGTLPFPNPMGLPALDGGPGQPS
jgi:hypothetical protein